jgi:hypothetical protein
VNPLESPWFFRMVEGSGKTPADRLLAVFSVAANWIAAPGIRETLTQTYTQHGHGMQACLHLKRFLTDLASSAGAEKPEILASHLVILLQGAIVEELRNPDLHAMNEAANAARAVISQSRSSTRRTRFALLSAGGVAPMLLGAFLSWHMLMPAAPKLPAAGAIVIASNHAMLLPAGISPSDMEAILNLHEQFEKGVCPSPQLLMLPPGQMTAYTNVINFRTPENPAADRENLKALMAWFNRTQSTECYYAPKNGHTTVTWTKG